VPYLTAQFKEKLTQYLFPLGNSVFTVTTTKELKKQLHQTISGQATTIGNL